MASIFAYLDPGSGGLIIQAAIAALVAIPVIFRQQLARVVHGVRRLTGRRQESSTHDG